MRLIAELEQALMVCDWRVEQDYSDIRWSVETTQAAELSDGNLTAYGYLV